MRSCLARRHHMTFRGRRRTRSFPTSSAKSRAAPGSTPSRATRSGCSTPSPARGCFAATLPPRVSSRAPARRHSSMRSRSCATRLRPGPRPHEPSSQGLAPMFGVPPGEIALLAIGLLVGGVVTGLLAGLFGIGGGAVVVPALFGGFGILGGSDKVLTELCVGTSLAIIVPTNIRSYLVHRAKGAVDHQVVKTWVVPALLGVAIGSVIAAFAPSAVFRLAFVVMAGVIAFKLLFGRDSWRLADDFPGQPKMSAFGLLVGLSSALMGVSGGSISNMIQTLYGRTIHQA